MRRASLSVIVVVPVLLLAPLELPARRQRWRLWLDAGGVVGVGGVGGGGGVCLQAPSVAGFCCVSYCF